MSNHATIWRRREAFLNDFAARIQWTHHNDITQANHAPVIIVNKSSAGSESLFLEVEASTYITLGASDSYDPDGDELSFR